MFEYEYRLTVSLKNRKEMYNILSKFKNVKKTMIIYLDSFRFKNNKWEFKEVLSQICVYYFGLWFKFVESRELAFKHLSQEQYDFFYKNMGFKQSPFTFEYRHEITLSKQAKLYTFERNQELGMVFEYEQCLKRKKIPAPVPNPQVLIKYNHILKLFSNKTPMPYELKHCQRKPVYHTDVTLSNCLIAVKHDGIFGHVCSYKNCIYELWEGNTNNLLLNASIGDGIVFGAEKMSDGTVILLDVYQVRGLPVYHTESIFLEFLPQLKNLPAHYKVQTYYKDLKDVPTNVEKSDGIIFHNLNDVIYKYKPRKTIDLLYNKGYFILKNNLKVKAQVPLLDGTIYECDLQYNVIKQRTDRFTGNTVDQLAELNMI
jgi:hypothetical protein